MRASRRSSASLILVSILQKSLLSSGRFNHKGVWWYWLEAFYYKTSCVPHARCGWKVKSAKAASSSSPLRRKLAQVSSPPLVVMQRMAPFAGRTILYIDTTHDGDNIAKLIQNMGLKAHVVHEIAAVSDRESCPHVDTILLDSMEITAPLRDVEHLRYIPIVLLSPSRSSQGLNLKRCLDNSISSQVNISYSPQDLASALISALESNTVRPIAASTGVNYDILLAEDNVVNHKLGVQILNKYGHQVEIAENGAPAVDALKQRIAEGHPFDIVLIDVSMPYMGGMEATELI